MPLFHCHDSEAVTEASLLAAVAASVGLGRGRWAPWGLQDSIVGLDLENPPVASPMPWLFPSFLLLLLLVIIKCQYQHMSVFLRKSRLFLPPKAKPQVLCWRDQWDKRNKSLRAETSLLKASKRLARCSLSPLCGLFCAPGARTHCNFPTF